MQKTIQARLARIISLLCGLGFNTLFAPYAFGFLEPRLEEAQQSEFFTWFHLEQTDTTQDGQGHAIISFKPEGEKFRAWTTVNVTVDKHNQVLAMELILARSFIEDRRDDIFARDIAKSFLRAALSQEDHKAITDLVNEIEYPQDLMILPLTARQVEVQLPAIPTPGYRTFLGQQPAYTQTLSRSMLRLENRKGVSGELLLISLQMK